MLSFHSKFAFSSWPVPAQGLPFPTRPAFITCVLARFSSRCFSHPLSSIFSHFHCLLMQSELTLLAAGISIVLQYLNSSMEQQDRNDWTLRASRCENIEEIFKACAILLECCGRSDYMRSIYHLWALCSNALFLFEQQWWPDQPTETRTHVATPQVPLKLSALLRPGWRDQHRLVRLGMASLVVFRDWFMEFFDAHLHQDVLNIVRDSLLIFQTAVDLFDLHAAVHDPPTAALPDVFDPPVESTADSSAPTGGTLFVLVQICFVWILLIPCFQIHFGSSWTSYLACFIFFLHLALVLCRLAQLNSLVFIVVAAFHVRFLSISCC